MGMGFHTGLIAFVADLLAINRKLMVQMCYSIDTNNLASMHTLVANNEI